VLAAQHALVDAREGALAQMPYLPVRSDLVTKRCPSDRATPPETPGDATDVRPGFRSFKLVYELDRAAVEARCWLLL
jgi:hypothetical protein